MEHILHYRRISGDVIYLDSDRWYYVQHATQCPNIIPGEAYVEINIKYLEYYCKSWDQILWAQLYWPFHFFGDFSEQFSFLRRGIWGKHFRVMISFRACRNKINHRGLIFTVLWSSVKTTIFFYGSNWNLNTYSVVLQNMKIHYKVAKGVAEIMFSSGLISDCQYEVCAQVSMDGWYWTYLCPF